jgi:hypothetical protein
MSTPHVSSRTQVAIPQATLAEIGKRGNEQSIGTYVSATELLYFVISEAGFSVFKRKISSATDFKGSDVQMLKIDEGHESDLGSGIGRDLRDIFTGVLNVPEETVKKMSVSDFAKTRFLTQSDGVTRDLTMAELETALEGGEGSPQIAAITFPICGIFYGAVRNNGDPKALLKFMRRENYTGKEFEIYTARGKIRAGNEVFKPILQRFFERSSTIFFTASVTISGALVAQVASASLAAGALTFACPPVLIALFCLAIGLIIAGAILLFAASRIENTVSLPQLPKQPTQMV